MNTTNREQTILLRQIRPWLPDDLPLGDTASATDVAHSIRAFVRWKQKQPKPKKKVTK